MLTSIDCRVSAGGVQHLARLLGRGRAMEAILGADDFDAGVAERYGGGRGSGYGDAP